MFNTISLNEKAKGNYLANPFTFSGREIEIIKLSCKELNSQEIAAHLFITARTVEGHKFRMMAKTASKNFVGVIVVALKSGVFNIDEI